MDLSTIHGVIFDMDGVLYRGSRALPGMVEMLAFLQQRSIPFVMATNNSSKTPTDYHQKLLELGAENLNESQFVTSGSATAHYLQQQYPPGTNIYVIGREGLETILETAGFTITPQEAKIVVVGVDFDFHYDKAQIAMDLIQAGADFVGTNPDVTFPTPHGLAPGAGSILAMIETATSVSPTVVGKPEPLMFTEALDRLGTEAAKTLMVGDRIGTDIVGGQSAGCQTALLLTGVTSHPDLIASSIQPDGVYRDLPHLLTDWKRVI